MRARAPALLLGTLVACADGSRGGGGSSAGTSAGSGSGSGADDDSGDVGSGGDDGGESGSSGAESSSGSSGTSGSGSSGGTTGGTSTGGSSTSTSDDGGDGGVRLDVGPGMSTGGSEGGSCDPSAADCGCNAVDLLFVIDNSGSMQDYQNGLAAVFPDFVDAILASLPAETDLHVGITSTSFGSPSAGGKGSSGCDNSALDAEAQADHYPPPSQPNGQNGSQGRLYEYGGKRYFAMNTSEDPTALKDWFTSAAISVGDQGSNWEMVSAGGAWIAQPDNATFNAGFLRDAGAVLVLFVLTDEFDNSPEAASTYHDLLSGAKAACGGDACIIAGGLTPTCVPTTGSNVLGQFLNSFGEPAITGDIGSPGNTTDYPTVLGETLAQVIAETCEAIPPVG